MIVERFLFCVYFCTLRIASAMMPVELRGCGVCAGLAWPAVAVGCVNAPESGTPELAIRAPRALPARGSRRRSWRRAASIRSGLLPRENGMSFTGLRGSLHGSRSAIEIRELRRSGGVGAFMSSSRLHEHEARRLSFLHRRFNVRLCLLPAFFDGAP